MCSSSSRWSKRTNTNTLLTNTSTNTLLTNTGTDVSLSLAQSHSLLREVSLSSRPPPYICISHPTQLM
jgi:hypothetical protein